mmetsp:Transcript_23451/g.59876  ORF Transcript_23451/g.59876 Transcript_23451/m.59876 type:complete len:227 (-) Transcript_23451:514-1194(-)
MEQVGVPLRSLDGQAHSLEEWKRSSEVRCAIPVALLEVVQYPIEHLGALAALGGVSLGLLRHGQHACHQLRRRHLAPVFAQDLWHQRLLCRKVHADLCTQRLHALAEGLRGLAPRLAGRPVGGFAQLVDDPLLEPRDGQKLELDRSMVREELGAVLSLHLARRCDEPVVVHLDLDSVVLADKGAPRTEEAEERSHAPRFGQVAKILGLQSALHLEHIAAQGLVSKE